ncbi:MAG: DUF711 family protein [Sedimentisphaerales bacterium]|jgi:uncharacterized protein (UPF0210 family)
MKIRTITLGIDLGNQADSSMQHEIGSFFSKANELFSKYNFETRTQRIALPPFEVRNKTEDQTVLSTIENVSVLCKDNGIRWFCVPFKTLGQDMQQLNAVAIEIANKYKNAFINYILTQNNQLSLKSALYAGKFIKLVSRLSENGIDNFRCGASFNCKANGAYFPFTYHSGKNSFSIALEITPIIVNTVKSNKNEPVEKIRDKIIDALLPIFIQIDKISREIELITKIKYNGIDTSIAPHPEDPEHSVSYIVELLGIEVFGGYGSTFVTSFLTDILKNIVGMNLIKTIGFNGVMYSVLEDPAISKINKDKSVLSIEKLILFSTVCACGLDMVPVPGDISDDDIGSILLDVAALSNRLQKPLGVRLLPIPGKSAGQITDFDHDFLCNTKIVPTSNKSLSENFFNSDKPFGYLS